MKRRKITKSTASLLSVKSPNPQIPKSTGGSSSSSSDGPPPLGRWTCYHGDPDEEEDEEELPWSPAADKSVESINKLYMEAARRLPLDEIPGLVDCVGKVGFCFGLADPVSNIILNAIAGLDMGMDLDQEHPSPPPSKKKKRTRTSYSTRWFISHPCFNGLLAFMQVYFRYLTDDQARQYLYLASYDLLLAIKLVHQDRCLPHQPPLLPDGGKMKNALRIAARRAGHPAPDHLARAMTARYPSPSRIMDKLLQGSEDLLTTHDVRAIRDLLLAHQFHVDFPCCPNGDACAAQAVNHGILQIGTEIVKPIHLQPQQLQYIPDMTFDTAAMETKLSKCIRAHATTGSGGRYQVNYDLSPPCEYVLSLQMCLIDTIHGFYIRALAALPLPMPAGDDSIRRGRLLRSLIVSGHCYGPLDPISNIILNTVMYNAMYPHLPPWEGNDEVDLPQDILNSHAMYRMASCSLDGLVALLHAITTISNGVPISKHEAVEYLWSKQCDLTEKLKQTVMTKNLYAVAAKASKHPQHTTLGSLLVSLSNNKLDHLRYLLRSITDGSGCVISSADWEQLNAMIQKQLSAVIARLKVLPFVPQDLATLSRSWSASVNLQSSVRGKLEELLVRYCRQHPWEPRYEIDLICGVQGPKSQHWKCYHANFLASAHGTVLKLNGEATTTLTPVRTLFFAEFWDSQPGRFNKSNSTSICYPVQDYRTSFGRCSFCNEGNTIVHPPCATGSHSNDGRALVIRDYGVNPAIRMWHGKQSHYEEVEICTARGRTKQG